MPSTPGWLQTLRGIRLGSGWWVARALGSSWFKSDYELHAVTARPGLCLHPKSTSQNGSKSNTRAQKARHVAWFSGPGKQALCLSCLMLAASRVRWAQVLRTLCASCSPELNNSSREDFVTAPVSASFVPKGLKYPNAWGIHGFCSRNIAMHALGYVPSYLST